MNNAPDNPRPSALSVLRHREFALYWGGQTISLTGMWMQNLAQSWVVVGFTSSAMVLGLLNFASSMPMLALTLFGGAFADRMDKRKILLATQCVLMLLAFAMAGLVASGYLKLWHIFVLAFLGGIASAYDMPANQAFTPELVEREEIPQAIALNQSSFHGSRVVGPALAGVCIHALGVVSAFIANGLSFLAVIASLLMIRSRPRSAQAPKGSPLHAMRDGLAYVKDRPRLVVLMGLTVLTSMLVFPNMAILMPLYVKTVLHSNARGLGLIMGSSGCGAFLGSVLLLGVRKEQRFQRIMMGMVGITTALCILSFSRMLEVSCMALFINSLSLSSSLGISSTITQEVVPNHLRGRVMSLNTLMFVGVMPIAALLITGIADVVGIRIELLLASAIYGIGAILLARGYGRSPEIHDFEEPAEPGMVEMR